MKLTRLTRAAFLLVIFFALDKGLGLIRQVVIARQFGLSNELDAFNVANNLPDLLFALISGGALAIAFIPILTEVLTRQGRPQAWHLFSNIANLAFLVTAVLAIVVAVLADPMVRWEVGIAPGFTAQQQHLVAQLMRLNLIATLIFSISGLVMAGLQANQHFLLPALAPILYNLGQIFGALILAPTVGYTIAGVTLPAFGLGVYGLVYGVIGGAALHLLIQVPGLVKFRFIWNPGLGLKSDEVRKVLRLMGPRLITMLFIQMDFLVRDNLASRLSEGSVSALTYGWMLMQVPETIIGTAIGTAMLPTLSELFSKGENQQFKETVERAVRVLLALTLPVAVIFGAGLRPLLALVFNFDPAGTDLLLWTTLRLPGRSDRAMPVGSSDPLVLFPTKRPDALAGSRDEPGDLHCVWFAAFPGSGCTGHQPDGCISLFSPGSFSAPVAQPSITNQAQSIVNTRSDDWCNHPGRRGDPGNSLAGW